MRPKTRLENFLAKIAGSPDAKELEPETRIEYFLNDIAENGGGSGDSTGDEVHAAVDDGQVVYVFIEGAGFITLSKYYVNDDYKTFVFSSMTPSTYNANTKNCS
jgi:hypothetical protein